MHSLEHIDSEVQRLVNMLGSDPAFYLLSLHAFAEMVMNQNLSHKELYYDAEHYNFQDKLYLYRKMLIDRHKSAGHNSAGGHRIKGISHLDSMSKTHHLTNKTRHNFGRVSIEEANAGTWSFLEFCRLSGIESRHFQALRDNLDIWEKRETTVDMANELRKIRFSVHLKDMEIQDLNRSLVKLSDAEKRMDEIDGLLRDKDRQIEELKNTAYNRSKKIDELRQERHELGEELRQLRRSNEGQKQVAGYRDELLRLSHYTRTRRDYERSIVRLSGEQKELLKSVSAENTLLVRGAAGTGKTIVLLELLRQNVSQHELFVGNGEIMLLTYANTLVKYDRYISEILGIADKRLVIRTVDSFITSQFKIAFPESEIRYDNFLSDMLEELLEENPELDPGTLSSRDIAFEIDNFLWAYGIDRHEYVDQMYNRGGLKHRLDSSQRSMVWDLQELVRGQMSEQHIYTRNLALQLMLGKEAQSDKRDMFFVDEVQDLPPVVLKFLSGRSRHLVMAGDADQSIYGLQSPFSRAGIDIRGKTKVLNQNFRNTIPILDFAELYRNESGLSRLYKTESQGRKPIAFRDGPPVEMHIHEDMQDMYQSLLDRLEVYRSVLDYDDENICIICPDNSQVERIQSLLQSRANIHAVSIRDPAFSFTHSNGAAGKSDEPGHRHDSQKEISAADASTTPKAEISQNEQTKAQHLGPLRLSSIHSAKGLDFPVVLLFLPFLTPGSLLATDYQDMQRKNLIYVGLTRAMDHLEIFTSVSALKNNALKPLKASYEASRKHPEHHT